MLKPQHVPLAQHMSRRYLDQSSLFTPGIPKAPTISSPRCLYLFSRSGLVCACSQLYTRPAPLSLPLGRVWASQQSISPRWVRHYNPPTLIAAFRAAQLLGIYYSTIISIIIPPHRDLNSSLVRGSLSIYIFCCEYIWIWMLLTTYPFTGSLRRPFVRIKKRLNMNAGMF